MIEKFAVRFNKQTFIDHLYRIEDFVQGQSFNKTDPACAVRVVELRKLSQLCREQSLTTVGKISPCRELSKYANYLDVMVTAALIDKSEQNFNIARNAFSTGYSEFVKQIENRFQIINLTVQNEPANPNTALDHSVMQVEQRLKQEVLDIEAVKPLAVNVPVKVIGSVAIHQFFKNLDFEHSVMKFGGIKFSNSNKSEITTPVTVIHNQTMLMVNLKALKFHFRKEPLTSKEVYERKQAIINKIKEANFKDADFDMSRFVSGGVLISRLFRGYAFLWYMPKSDVSKLEHIPENKTYLMWS